jgi:hypothetical protein
VAYATAFANRMNFGEVANQIRYGDQQHEVIGAFRVVLIRSRAIRAPAPSIPAKLSVLWITLGIVISVGVRAANLDPIVCLPQE